MRRAIRILVICAIVLVAAVASLPLFIHANDFRPTIQTKLSQALGREVRVGNLKLAILSGGVAADDLWIADDPAFSTGAFLQAKSLKVGVEMLPLIFSRSLNVTRVTIDQPQIVLLQASSAKWNFSSFGAKGGASAPAAPAAAQPAQASPGITLKMVQVNDGRVSLQRLGRDPKPHVLENVNAELHDFSPTSQFPFSVTAKVAGGGDIDLRGKLGPLDAADTAKTPGEASLKVKGLDLARSGVTAASTGIAGIASIDGATKSDGRTVHVEGKLRGEQLKLVKGGSPASRPVELDFTVEHDTATFSGTLNRGDLHIGKAEASITGTYSLAQEQPVLHLKLAGPGMPLPELVAMLPALDIVLPAGSSIQGGVAHARIAMDGPVDQLVSSGSLGVDNLRLAGFDLGSRLSTVERLAGIKRGPNTEIQTLSANIKVAPAGKNVDDIHVIVAGVGEITGAGTISPEHALDFRMHAKLHGSDALVNALAQSGDTGIPFMIQGTSSNPVFKADMKGIASEKLKQVTGYDAGKSVTGLVRGLLGGKKQK